MTSTPPPSTRALASALGVSKSTAHRDYQHVGMDGRCAGRDGKTYPASRSRHADVVALALLSIEQGRPVSEVADLIGVSPRTLRRWRAQWRLA